MPNATGAGTSARRSAETDDTGTLSAGAQEVWKNVEDLGTTVADTANRQYQRGHDAATDVVHRTEGAIRRNPFAAIGIGLGVGFLLGLVQGGRS